MKEQIMLDGEHLTTAQVVHAARGNGDEQHRDYPLVKLTPDAAKTLKEFRQGLEVCAKKGKPIYGFNTGCGSRKNIIIPPEEIEAYQRHYIPAHCVGVGQPFPEEIVRAAMVLRVNSFAKGNSGVRLELCQAILDLYNKGVIPYIPEKGSVGSSGDLCPLAHMSAVLTGIIANQKTWYKGQLLSAPAALLEAGLKPIVLQGKEAMGLTNGATFILAMGLLATYDAVRLLVYSNIAQALSMEAIRAEKNAFDPRIHLSRNHPGQQYIAEQILKLTEGSERMTETCRMVDLAGEVVKHDINGKKLSRVQDAYSFRCYPQVAGSTYEWINRIEEILGREINASTDNPLIFRNPKDPNDFNSLSGGNFHGEPLAHACDMLKIVVQSLANISNSRFYALTKPTCSYGLPADLAGNSELNTGFMILQYTVADLVSKNKVLCHPAVVDSIPTSGDQEDYVSMGSTSARNALEVVENSYAVIAAEILAACQAISLTQKDLGNPKLGRGTLRAYEMVREVVSVMDDDRYLHTDHHLVINLLKSGKLLEVVQ